MPLDITITLSDEDWIADKRAILHARKAHVASRWTRMAHAPVVISRFYFL